ncbi:protein SSUH2 homolog isoform X2 [Varanus komodoensis]|uniref:protein SSUH2 homolog isoform X2 n=1 Tax=Varanus komodoensis TaxID=61221 RepID=UPI001CF79AFF|nr:protein SSUH2 homolog isoform X2 [Varanus komodoensis]
MTGKALQASLRSHEGKPPDWRLGRPSSSVFFQLIASATLFCVVDASTDSPPFEGASAPPYEPMENESIEESSTGDSVKEPLTGSSEQLSEEENEETPPDQRNWNIPSVSEDDVKKAFRRYAASKCCYRIAPAKHMNVQSITPLNIYRYRLETFTEMRETFLVSGVYNGEFIDSSASVPPPDRWEIMVDPPPLFTDCEMHLPVPHSYSVEICSNCKGRGTVLCQTCKGTGKKICSACDGTGTSLLADDNICLRCTGSGNIRCFSCHTTGWRKCCRCSGKGIVLFHTELTITWRNNILEHIADKDCGLPYYHFQDVAGKEIFCDEHTSVFPIVDFPEPSVDDYSRACIAQHKMQFSSQSLHRVVRQKQTVELVPTTKVEYEWKEKLYSFYIYGNENEVYTTDYPGKCCCSLM